MENNTNQGFNPNSIVRKNDKPETGEIFDGISKGRETFQHKFANKEIKITKSFLFFSVLALLLVLGLIAFYFYKLEKESQGGFDLKKVIESIYI